jgi:hypothetical protein
LESAENNMILAGIPPRAGGVSGHRLGNWASEAKRRCEMKGRLVAFVGVFCGVVFAVSVADARPKPKPPRPGGGKDKTRAECIVFVDNGKDDDSDHVYLVGGEDCAIEGCCPNAGPWPLYEMTLNSVWYTDASGAELLLDNKAVIGHLFMNGYGRNAPYEGWKVQFWTCNYQARRPVGGDFFFQIRGGTEVPQPKKSKVSVIEFLDADDATLWVYYEENDDCHFPSETGCEPCLNEMETGCNPWTDDECLYPCWIEEPIDNVSFVIVRTADLTYASGELGITCPDTPCSFSPSP